MKSVIGDAWGGCDQCCSAIDGWLMRLYAIGPHRGDAQMLNHLRHCPACRRQAALAWALLSDPDDGTIAAIPVPRLPFLPQVSSAL